MFILYSNRKAIYATDIFKNRLFNVLHYTFISREYYTIHYLCNSYAENVKTINKSILSKECLNNKSILCKECLNNKSILCKEYLNNKR